MKKKNLIMLFIVLIIYSLDCKSQDKGIVNYNVKNYEYQSLPTLQRYDRLFSISNDSVSEMILNGIKEDDIDYNTLKTNPLECLITMDSLGNIIDINMLSYFSDEFAKKCECIFRKSAPLNPFFYYEKGIYGSVVNLRIKFLDRGISIESEPFDLNMMYLKREK